MTHPRHTATVAAAMAAARLRAWRTSLLSLHKALIDAERRRYERVHGRIPTAHDALRLVLHDPWFEWLRPMADVIVTIDERLADETPVKPDELAAFRSRVRKLVQLENADGRFGDEYRRALQEIPEVVVTHGHLLGLLADDRPS